MCFDLETYQDGHLYQNHDGQFLPPDEIINKKRKEGPNLLKTKTDQQLGEWISDQKVFLISIVVGKFDRHNFFLESKYSLILRMSPQIRLPDIDMDVQAEIFSDEKTLLRRFLNIIGNHQPHCFLNHNLMQFDLQVLKNRLNYFDLPFPTVRDDTAIDVLNQLSPRWREVVIRENGFFLLDILVFAKKFIKIPYGHGLGNLAYKIINEKTIKLHQEFSHILPIDCLATSHLIQKSIQYGLHDCILCLKLFVLFQKDKFMLSSYKTIRATVNSMVKHSNVIRKLRETAVKFLQLRIHTTCCLKLYLQSCFERNLSLPRISAQLYESLMARIRYISAEYYGQEMLKPTSAFPQNFENFVYGEGDYRLSTSFEQQKLNKTLSYVDHLRYRLEFFPRFPTDGFSRPPQYMDPVMFANFENNLKLNYEKQINRFINVFFDKPDVETVLAEMHKLGGYSTPLSTIISLYRFRLRQFKNLFLVDDKVCVSSLSHHAENISDLLNDEFFDLCEKHDIRNNELRDIFEGIIEPFTCQIENLVTDENLVDNIFPVDIHCLADAVEKDPQIFLKPAITIAQYISKDVSKVGFPSVPFETDSEIGRGEGSVSVLVTSSIALRGEGAGSVLVTSSVSSFLLRGEGTGSVLVTSSIAEDRGTSSTLSSFTYREGEVGSGSVALLPSLLCICVAGSCCMLVRGLGSKISC
ncbi:hypothetical protein P9112_007719 [Eukaryota sp. TZLM1-RC]